MATTRPRYMISVDPEMFEKIEDFRFKNRYPTRSEATAELIRIGLEHIETVDMPLKVEDKKTP